MGRHKKHRGGQPGNHNALKHGLYANNFTPEQLKQYSALINNGTKDAVFAALKVKVENAIINSHGNYRVLREGAGIIVKYISGKNHYNRRENAFLKKSFRNYLKAVAAGDADLTNRIVSETLKDAEILQNERG